MQGIGARITREGVAIAREGCHQQHHGVVRPLGVDKLETEPHVALQTRAREAIPLVAIADRGGRRDRRVCYLPAARAHRAGHGGFARGTRRNTR